MKIYLYGAIAVVIGYLLWRENSLAHKLTASRVEAAQAVANLTAEKEARDHERKIANDASNQFQNTVTSLQTELATRPLKPVIIRVPVRTSLPAANGAATATTGSDANPEGRIDGTVEKDIGPELANAWLDCQMNTAQLTSLQDWVRAR